MTDLRQSRDVIEVGPRLTVWSNILPYESGVGAVSVCALLVAPEGYKTS